METEAILTFIYKTVNEYSQFEDFIEQKLQSNYNQNNISNGYLTFDYLKMTPYN